MEPELSFRSEGATSLIWLESMQSWACSDSAGHIIFKPCNGDFKETSIGDIPITTLAANPNQKECTIACNDTLCLRGLPDLSNEIQSILLRSTLPFTHLQYDHDGTFLFAASQEPDLTILSTVKNCQENKIATNSIGIQTFSISADSRYIGIVDMRGNVHVYALAFECDSFGEKRLSKKDYLFLKSNIIHTSVVTDPSSVRCKISWYPFPNKKICLALPSLEGSVVLITPNNQATSADSASNLWLETTLMANTESLTHNKEHLNIVNFSPSGNYLLSADMAGTMLIWSFDCVHLEQSQPLRQLRAYDTDTISRPLWDSVWGQCSGDNYLIVLSGADWIKLLDAVPMSALKSSHPVVGADHLTDLLVQKDKDRKNNSAKDATSTGKKVQRKITVCDSDDDDVAKSEDNIISTNASDYLATSDKDSNETTATTVSNSSNCSISQEETLLDDSAMNAAFLAACEAAEAEYAISQQHVQTESTPTLIKNADLDDNNKATAVKLSDSTSSVTATSEIVTTSISTEAVSRKRLTKTNAASPTGTKRVAFQDDDDKMLFEENSDHHTGVTAETKKAVVAASAMIVSDANGEENNSIAAIKRNTQQHKASTLLDNQAAEGGMEEEDEDDATYDEDEDDDDDELDRNKKGGASASNAMALADMLRLASKDPTVAGQLLLGNGNTRKKRQSVFQPSSCKFDEKRRRYLVWNNVGSVVLREESIENRVEIRFSNLSGPNRNENFADRSGFVMGSLSYEGAVFASEPEVDETATATAGNGSGLRDTKKELPGSTVYYHAFSGQKQLAGVNESFRFTFPDSEAALAVAVGKGWLAVATSRNLLYIYSSGGVPCAATALPGSVLTMSGSDAQLAVVYYQYNASADADTIATPLFLDLYEINWQDGCSKRQIANSVPLPVPPQQQHQVQILQTGLKTLDLQQSKQSQQYHQAVDWLGFDVDNKVVMMLDSHGMLWAMLRETHYHQQQSWQWMAVLDVNRARKSIDHVLWPVMVKFGKLVFVSLNGESKPSIFPQPIVSTKPLRVVIPSLRDDGKDVGDTYKERMHSILWGGAVAAHTQAVLLDTTAATANNQGKVMVSLEDPIELESRLDALQFEADKAIVKALQDACQHQRIPLALSLALKLSTEKAMEGAITIANHFGRAIVAETLDGLLEHKRAAAEELLAVQQQQQFGYTASSNNIEYTNNNSSKDMLKSKQVDRGSYNDSSSNSSNNNNNIRLFSSSSMEVPTPTQFYADHSSNDEKFTNSNNSSTVGNTSNYDVELSQQTNKPASTGPRNPFALNSTGNTPLKRKSVIDGIQGIIGSPSPKKLNRQSTFSQQARKQQLSGKKLL